MGGAHCGKNGWNWCYRHHDKNGWSSLWQKWLELTVAKMVEAYRGKNNWLILLTKSSSANMSGYQNVSLRLGYGSVDHDDHPTFTNLGRVFQFFDIFRGGGGLQKKRPTFHNSCWSGYNKIATNAYMMHWGGWLCSAFAFYAGIRHLPQQACTGLF